MAKKVADPELVAIRKIERVLEGVREPRRYSVLRFVTDRLAQNHPGNELDFVGALDKALP